MIRALTCLAALAAAVPAGAQGPAPAKPQAPPVSSLPLKELVRAELTAAEAGSPEALAASLYAFISGPAGQKRDLERIRALFHPTARILVSGRHPERGAFLRMIELEAFLGFAIPQWEQGFFERATGVAVQKLEGLAQVWTPYEIRRKAEGPAEYTGANALQCAFDGKRWWITHLAFQSVATEALQAPPAASAK
jgi:hypothetical protein